MMTDQWDVVTTNVTQIDKLKGDFFLTHNHNPASIMDHSKPSSGFLEVFGLRRAGATARSGSASSGEGFRLDWLAPFATAHIPQGMRDEIMGFCAPCSNHFCGNNDNKCKEKDDDDEQTELIAGGPRSKTAEMV
jgi:hypothetical protein